MNSANLHQFKFGFRDIITIKVYNQEKLIASDSREASTLILRDIIDKND